MSWSSYQYFQDKNCLNVYWKIKNFSYCWESIRSPDFTYFGVKYHLRINNSNCEIITGNSGINCMCSRISFLASDGSGHIEPKTNYNFISRLDIEKNIIFGERRSSFLPKDTLTIKCQFDCERYDHVSLKNTGTVLIQSLIGVKRQCFLWRLNDVNQESQRDVLSPETSEQYGNIQLHLKSVGGINSDKQFYIEISKDAGEKCYCVLKVSVLDIEGNALNYVSDEYIFQKEAGRQIWRFPPIIRSSRILTCSNKLLSNNALVLKCDFTISLGKISDQTATYSYYEDVLPLLKDHGDFENNFKRSSSTDLKGDLKRILDHETFFDVSLQIGSDVIRVHKNVLSARSPVFLAMFSKDMKETINKTVVIEDIDVDTIRRLLLYMYTDTIADFQWDNIMSLYFAADKYEVLSLKQKCASFLKDNISFKNVCEVLVLADMHQDANLKSVILDFFTKYDTEIFASDSWKELEKTNSSLACQTLREICSNKQL